MPQSDHHSERNAQTAVNADGSRYVIHPADARGKFTTARRLSAYALINQRPHGHCYVSKSPTNAFLKVAMAVRPLKNRNTIRSC